MSRSTISIWLLLFLSTFASDPVTAQVFERTAELHGDSIVFPITIVNAFPFISGTVNGIPGKFMFDTGYEKSISLNDNLVKLPNKKLQGSGVVGSGQSFKQFLNDTISEIKLGNGITYQNLENIRSANYDFLQKHITPDCIGYIGHDFFKGYLFKLDYIGNKNTFYKSTAERRANNDYLANEKVLAIIDFEIRKLPNHPLAKVTIDGVEIQGAFDTGQYGSLLLDPSAEKRLKNRGYVQVSGTDSDGDTLLKAKNVVMGGKLKVTLKGLGLASLQSTKIVRRELAITETNILGIGYRFYSQYKTVWDYEKKKIYVLEY